MRLQSLKEFLDLNRADRPGDGRRLHRKRHHLQICTFSILENWRKSLCRFGKGLVIELVHLLDLEKIAKMFGEL